MAIIKYRDKTTGNIVEMLALRGEKGDKGDTGPQGPAYVLTAEDKQSIVNDVLAALPTYNGEVESV